MLEFAQRSTDHDAQILFEVQAPRVYCGEFSARHLLSANIMFSLDNSLKISACYTRVQASFQSLGGSIGEFGESRANGVSE